MKPPFERGWGNGYVVIPKGHHLISKGYEDIDVEVHGGGLTFGESVDNLKWKELRSTDKGGYVVGFHTGYGGDNERNWSRLAVLKEAKKLKHQLEIL